MTTLIESQISTVLFEKFTAAINNALPTKWPLRTFNIPSDGKWFEVLQIRNNPSDRYFGDEKIYQGIARILLHWPSDDSGALAPVRALETVAALIPKGQISFPPVRVTLTETPDITDAVEDGADNIFALTMRYQCFYTG